MFWRKRDARHNSIQQGCVAGAGTYFAWSLSPEPTHNRPAPVGLEIKGNRREINRLFFRDIIGTLRSAKFELEPVGFKCTYPAFKMRFRALE